MPKYCHTCGGELPPGRGESPFCPHCGTPQLCLSIDYQSVETGGEPVATTSAESTGTLPPPRPQQVDWQMAIRCAAVVAGVGGVLSLLAVRIPILTGASLLWMMSGSLIVMGLYQNRRPLASMNARIGARIGVVVGLCLALAVAASLTLAGVIARFGLHAMGNFDAQLAVIFQTVVQRQSNPFPPEALQLIHSQEFRAGYILFLSAVLTSVILMLSTLGGAVAGLLRMRRKAAA